MPFATALSTHPVSSHATGELIGQVIEELGSHPDVALLLATPGHAGALEDVAGTLRRLLAPTVLIGATVTALAGQGADERGGPAMGLWAGATGPVHPLRLPGPPVAPAFAPSGAVVVGLAGMAPSDLQAAAIEGRTVGALSAGGPLLLDDRLLASGAVGVAFGPGVRFEAVTAASWRPIGPAMSVTDADPARELVLGLDGLPALERLQRMAADEVPAEEIGWINRRLGIGPDPEDAPGGAGGADGEQGGAGGDPAASVFEVRGADRANGAIAAGPVPAGTRVRFWVGGDPETGLRRALAGRAADSALVFGAGPAARGYRPAPRSDPHDGDPRPGPAGGPGSPAPGPAGVSPAPRPSGRPSDGPSDRPTDRPYDRPTDRAFAPTSLPADAPIVADALRLRRVLGLVAPAQIGPRGGRLGVHRREVAIALLSDVVHPSDLRPSGIAPSPPPSL